MFLVGGAILLAGSLAYLFFGAAPRPATNNGRPIGGQPPLALGPPAEAVLGQQYWYNFSVVATCCIPVAASSVAVKALNATVAPDASWQLDLYVGSTFDGSYMFSNDTWIGVGSTVFTSDDVLAFGLLSDSGLGGDSFELMGTGSWSGSVDVEMP